MLNIEYAHDHYHLLLVFKCDYIICAIDKLTIRIRSENIMSQRSNIQISAIHAEKEDIIYREYCIGTVLKFTEKQLTDPRTYAFPLAIFVIICYFISYPMSNTYVRQTESRQF